MITASRVCGARRAGVDCVEQVCSGLAQRCSAFATLLVVSLLGLSAAHARDCNANGVPDADDITNGTSVDCDENGVPDECDVALVALDAVDRGWWRNDGSHDSANDNTLIGQYGGGLILKNNAYFIFDVSGFSPTGPPTLRLEVQDYRSPDPSETVIVYDVSTDRATLEASGSDVAVFQDLQTGNVYATFTVTPDDVGTVLEVVLNALATLDIESAGGLFAIGLHVDGLNPPGVDQWVQFSFSGEPRVHQLTQAVNDCNENGVPDACDIASGSSQDTLPAGGDGIPDDCQADCNANGILDINDLVSGASLDCNANAIPDECDTADGTSEDCNGDSIPDDCFLRDCDPNDPTCQDCNGNGVPDVCDIAGGASDDCNGNQVPDECEIVATLSVDAVQRGTWRSDGVHTASDNRTHIGELQGRILNGYLIFDVAEVGVVQDQTLRLSVPEYFGDDPFETVTVYDVSTDAARLEASGNSIPIFEDLQSGSAYATFTVSPADAGSVLDIPLKAQAVADINAAGDFFAVGLHVENTVFGASGAEGVRFGRSPWVVVHRLVLITAKDDCNGNGVLDGCDVADGTSPDILPPGGDGIPDECQLDCNANGFPDPDDITDGTSPDCNGNGVPDECDVASGISPDCNGNGVPDECDPDCNANGVPDACDIADATSFDCDQDGVPDECGVDCNGNGVADECDVDPGDPDGNGSSSFDCDVDGIPDECGIDCNGNGIADECDVDPSDPDGNGASSADCNANGVPDECELFGPFPGHALDYDGSDYASVPHDAALRFSDGDSITIEAWIRPDREDTRRTIVAKNRVAVQNYFLRIKDGKMQLGYRNASDTAHFVFQTTDQVVIPGKWCHVAATHLFGSSEAAIYIDGLPVSADWTLGPPDEGPAVGTASLNIGAQQNSAGSGRIHRFDGVIDEVRIWNATRSGAQIRANMRVGLTGTETGLVAYWRFDEGSGTVAIDLAGGHDATRSGARWVVTSACDECPGDVIPDGAVNIADLGALLSHYGIATGATREQGDLNGDGAVNITDLGELLANFGTSCF